MNTHIRNTHFNNDSPKSITLKSASYPILWFCFVLFFKCRVTCGIKSNTLQKFLIFIQLPSLTKVIISKFKLGFFVKFCLSHTHACWHYFSIHWVKAYEDKYLTFLKKNTLDIKGFYCKRNFHKWIPLLPQSGICSRYRWIILWVEFQWGLGGQSIFGYMN